MIAAGDLMTYRQYSAGVVLAAVALLGIAGCGKPTGQPAGQPTGTPAVNSPPSPAASTSVRAGNGGASLVKGSDLAEYTIWMPVPKGAPAGGTWRDVMPGEDGRVSVYYVDNNDNGYVRVDFLDCRLPAVQAVKDKAAKDQAGFDHCFRKPTKTLKGYPMILPDDPDFAYRTLVVNHVYVSVSVYLPFDEKFKAADVEEFLGTLDLDTLARL
jgi:hypothetical protein